MASHWQTAFALAGLLAFAVFATLTDQAFYVSLATRIAILALAGAGLNLALGYGGMVSFGHAAFFGLGSYAAGVLFHHAFESSNITNWPLQIAGSDAILTALAAAALVAAFAALLIGAISLRTTGVYFIMITLAFAQMIYYFAISFPTYGGEDGLPLYARATLLGTDISGEWDYFLLCYLCLAINIVLSTIVVASRFGTALQGLRDNDIRMQTVGFNPFPYRLAGFVISAAITGLAGALYAHLDGFASPANLSWHRSGELIVIVIIGGVARIPGPIYGAAILILLESFLGDITDRWQFFLGLMLLGIVLFARGGVTGFLDRGTNLFATKAQP